MKNNQKILLISVLAAVAGVIVYKKVYARPKVDFTSIDWLNGTAQITVNGQPHTLLKGTGIAVKGYTVTFAESYVPAKNGQDISSLVLKRGDAIVDTIATR